ncbi:MAG: hypothetical protein LBT85_03600 [Bifidobacteriaceae bacterium]|jgi:hypothetical protein|nr:hypothetical protein [Bifidobacteriaceae bacterium]
METILLFSLFLYLLFWTPRKTAHFKKNNNPNNKINKLSVNDSYISSKKISPLELLDLLAQYLKIEPNTKKAFEKVFYKNINLENNYEIVRAFYNKCSNYSKRKHIKIAALNTILAIKVSSTLGIPLHKTLLKTKKVLSDEIETMNLWKISIAGPKTTTRILQVLPILGIFIGFIFGVNPLAVFFDFSFGTIIFAIGLSLNLIGAHWIKSMEKKIWKQFYF